MKRRKTLKFILLLFILIIPVCWLSKGDIESKTSIFYLIKQRFTERKSEVIHTIQLDGEIFNNEDLIQKLVEKFPDYWAGQRLIFDNRVPQEPNHLINFHFDVSVNFPVVFDINHSLGITNDNSTSGIGGVIIFPEYFEIAKSPPLAKEKIAELNRLLIKKVLIKTTHHTYEMIIHPFIATDCNIRTWGGVNSIAMNKAPSIDNQIKAFKNLGINTIFGPNVDRAIEYNKESNKFMKSSQLESQLMYAEKLAEANILPFMKHFVCPRECSNGLDTHDDVCTIKMRSELIPNYMLPYFMADTIIKKQWGIMLGHHVLTGIDSVNSLSLSIKAQKLIKQKFASLPITISDALSMRGILNNNTISYGTKTIKSVVADLILTTYYYNFPAYIQAAADNNFSKAYNQAAEKKILMTKYRMGLLTIRQLE